MADWRRSGDKPGLRVGGSAPGLGAGLRLDASYSDQVDAIFESDHRFQFRGRNAIEECYDKWDAVRAFREENCEKADALSPAEHYMYAKCTTKEEGIEGARNMAISETLYSLQKIAAQLERVTGLRVGLSVSRTGNCAPSPPSLETFGATVKGIVDAATESLKELLGNVGETGPTETKGADSQSSSALELRGGSSSTRESGDGRNRDGTRGDGGPSRPN